jgi:sugar O-acyltransferase (sialic acid O-acetyltransferase NeuD family)
MKNIVIYGSGGFGREVVWLINNINKVKKEWRIVGFIDDTKKDKYVKYVDNTLLLGGKEWFQTQSDELYVICAMGSSESRYKIYNELSIYKNLKLATLIDPSVAIDDTAYIGKGSIICYGSNIMAGAKLGKGIVLNIRTAIGHDCTVGDYCTCCVHTVLSGGSRLGEFCEIGSNSFLLKNITLASHVTVAPVSSVLSNLKESGIYSGNPARRVK